MDRSSRGRRLAADDAQQRILAHGQPEALREPGTRAAAQRDAEVVDRPVQPRRPLAGSPGNLDRQRLGEGPPRAIGGKAAEAARLQPQLDHSPMLGQVEQPPLVAAVHTIGQCATVGTTATRLRPMDEDDHAVRSRLNCIHRQPGRQQGAWVQKVHLCRSLGWGIPYQRPTSTKSATEPFFHA
jgi:hypothetical protein